MPIEQKVMKQDTRVLKDIAGDMGRCILGGTDLRFYDLFVWQKQTSERMLGVYPHPGTNYCSNVIEFVTVYVKPGKHRVTPGVKAANVMSDALHRNLTQQVAFMMPVKINRKHEGGHQAPFPERLPARLIRLYTFGACAGEGFAGEIVVRPVLWDRDDLRGRAAHGEAMGGNRDGGVMGGRSASPSRGSRGRGRRRTDAARQRTQAAERGRA
jgi:hypothetical protein